MITLKPVTAKNVWQPLALDYIRAFPFGKAECCFLSYEPENHTLNDL